MVPELKKVRAFGIPPHTHTHTHTRPCCMSCPRLNSIQKPEEVILITKWKVTFFLINLFTLICTRLVTCSDHRSGWMEDNHAAWNPLSEIESTRFLQVSFNYCIIESHPYYCTNRFFFLLHISLFLTYPCKLPRDFLRGLGLKNFLAIPYKLF
jgi:hypothetical protein